MSKSAKKWTALGILGVSILLCAVISPSSIGGGLVLLFFGGSVAALVAFLTTPPALANIAPPEQSTSITTSQPSALPPLSSAPTAAPVPTQSSTTRPSTTPMPPTQQTAPAPPPKKTSGTVLGLNTKTREYVFLPQAARRRGLYVVGKNGTGKTTFLVNVILQDIEQGMGVCFLDPHGDAITDIVRRLPKGREQDVILLDVLDTKYPFGLNLYECSDPQDLELAARSCEHVMHVFEKVWGVDSKNPSWGPAMEDLLRNTALTFIYKQGLTLAEMPLVLTDETAREKITSNLRSTQLRLFWQQFGKRKDKNEYMASTLNKVRAFLSNPIVEHIVGQTHTTIDFRAVMDEGKILLVKLPGRYEDITSLIGAVIIGQLLNAALSRVDVPEAQRRQFNVYADEYQRFATPDFATLLSEARKFGIATTIAHQFRDQLDEANRGATLNAANMVVFRVSGEDGEELAKEFNATPPEPEVIGQRPVLTPKREVIEHLLKNGHSNPGYAPFTQKWLAALTEIAGMKIDRPGSFRSHTVVGDVMQMRNASNYKKQVQLQTELKVEMQKLNNFLYEVMKERDDAKPIPRELFLVVAQASEFYPVIKDNNINIDNLLAVDATLRDQELNRIHQATHGNKKKQLPGEMAIHFVTSLRQLMEVLAEQPILVDSGQHEPIYATPRSYADVQNQIATDLANLPPYTAKCKVGHTEVVLQTLPLEAGISDEAFMLRSERIQERTRMRYCKERSLVEDEILTRQEALLEQEIKQRKTKDEEVI